jgi:hypothetical protein
MTPQELQARTKKFAVDVIRFAKAIPEDPINDDAKRRAPHSRRAKAEQSTIKHRQSSTNR